MIGSQADIALRLRSALPLRWFGDVTPILDTVLNGLAAGWEFLHELLQYTRLQARVSSASDVWLDIIAHDFFGIKVSRAPGQTDGAFRAVVRRNILRELGTRRSLASALTNLTGRAPVIFEPQNTSDTGGYGNLGMVRQPIGGGVGYGASGGWGNLNLPYQGFITAFRPNGNGVANVSGWCMNAGGYGIGLLEYADMDIIRDHVSDASILAEIVQTSPVGVVLWARISS